MPFDPSGNRHLETTSASKSPSPAASRQMDESIIVSKASRKILSAWLRRISFRIASEPILFAKEDDRNSRNGGI
jgi:hypothetical protein